MHTRGVGYKVSFPSARLASRPRSNWFSFARNLIKPGVVSRGKGEEARASIPRVLLARYGTRN